ncbi:MAG TPA: hypothetical protein VNT26_11920 [Candidatus Sulfotelmatobacter sp.]|nr:hypothetical protein [Candidatus Sulfotelmatobacter sp.]
MMGLLLAGCASNKPELALAPVGPPAFGAAPGQPNGSLVVFSAYDSLAHFSSLPGRLFYTDYNIYSADGKLLQRVHNDNGSSMEGPRKVHLPPGQYRVMARANGYGQVSVPVVIGAHQVTTVHLEGDGRWRGNQPGTPTNPVRLPDGQIVGWRAEAQDTAESGAAAGAQDHQTTLSKVSAGAESKPLSPASTPPAEPAR